MERPAPEKTAGWAAATDEIRRARRERIGTALGGDDEGAGATENC